MKRSRGSVVAFLFVTVATVVTSSAAHAAKEIGLGIAYDPRVPVGSFRDVIPNVAFTGLQAKWDYFPLDRLSLGVGVQYHLFQRGTQTDTVAIPNGAVTAPNYRYATFWSALPVARYYFSTRTFRPYVELGAGVSSSVATVLVSDLGVRNSGVAFIIQPSVGVLWRLPVSRSAGTGDGDLPPPSTGYSRKPLESMFGLTASLTYAFTTTDLAGASNVGYAGIQLGIYAKP